MSTYTTKEQWQSLYDDSVISGLRKVAIEKLQEDGNKVFPGTRNGAKEIWALCVAVADKIKNNHTDVHTGRSFNLGKAGHKSIFVTSASITGQTITVRLESDDDEYDLKYFTDNLSFYNNNYHGHVNVMPKNNEGGTSKQLRITHVLPMLSLGIFQATGGNWIDIENRNDKKKNFNRFESRNDRHHQFRRKNE
jgi:hypothetical protein